MTFAFGKTGRPRRQAGRRQALERQRLDRVRLEVDDADLVVVGVGDVEAVFGRAQAAGLVKMRGIIAVARLVRADQES